MKEIHYGNNRKIIKLESIRNKSKGKGLEECTFKPKVNQKSVTRRTMKVSSSLNNLQTVSSIQKYVYRMNKVREDKDVKKINADKQIGSGK